MFHVIHEIFNNFKLYEIFKPYRRPTYSTHHPLADARKPNTSPTTSNRSFPTRRPTPYLRRSSNVVFHPNPEETTCSRSTWRVFGNRKKLIRRSPRMPDTCPPRFRRKSKNRTRAIMVPIKSRSNQNYVLRQ